MKNKILAIMLTTGMMTGMMAAPAAVSAADVNPLEQLVNEMSNQILPNPDAETAETTETDDGSSVLADAGNANDEIDPSFSQYDSILAPSSIINEWIQQQNAANTEETTEPAETTPAEDEYLAGEEFGTRQDTPSVWYGSFAGTPVTVSLSGDAYCGVINQETANLSLCISIVFQIMKLKTMAHVLILKLMILFPKSILTVISGKMMMNVESSVRQMVLKLLVENVLENLTTTKK